MNKIQCSIAFVVGMALYVAGYYIGAGDVRVDLAKAEKQITDYAAMECVGSATATGDSSAAVTGSGNTITWNGKEEPAHVPYRQGMTLLPGQSTSVTTGVHRTTAINKEPRQILEVNQVTGGKNSPNVVSGGDVVITYPEAKK